MGFTIGSLLKKTSFNLTLVIVGLYNELLQIRINHLGLQRSLPPLTKCQRPRVSLHFQVLIPPVPLPSLTEVTGNASSTKKIPALVPDSNRNLMTVYKKNLVHGFDIANLFLSDLEVTCMDLAIIREVGLKLVW